jgi:membrane-associated phospholipid phosphatase
LLMAFSRMHNGMHYPSDVLMGSLLGIGYWLLSVWIAKKIMKKK